MLGNVRHHLYKLARILSPEYLRLMEELAKFLGRDIPAFWHLLDQRWLVWSSWMYCGNGHGEWNKFLQAKEERILSC